MTWDESTSTWVINIRHLVTGVEKTIRADFVVAGTGPLALPKMPQNIPGISSFKGRQAHTAQYDSSLIVDGKKVVLVGNGGLFDRTATCKIKPTRHPLFQAPLDSKLSKQSPTKSNTSPSSNIRPPGSPPAAKKSSPTPPAGCSATSPDTPSCAALASSFSWTPQDTRSERWKGRRPRTS